MKLKSSVLLIEDNDGLRRLLDRYLSQYFELLAAKDGVTGMQYLFSNNTPDVLVMSIDITGISGFELIEQLRANRLIGTLPIIVLSSENDESIRQRCFDLGVNACFDKPFSPDHLHQKIEELVPVSVYEN